MFMFNCRDPERATPAKQSTMSSSIDKPFFVPSSSIGSKAYRVMIANGYFSPRPFVAARVPSPKVIRFRLLQFAKVATESWVFRL
jgi:hypothetical protein